MIDTQFLMWTELVGFVAPLIISFVQQEPWSQSVRSLVMFGACIVFALGNCYLQGKLSFADPQDLITSFLLITVTAISSYKGLWQPTNIAPHIEHLTSGAHTEQFHQKMSLRAA